MTVHDGNKAGNNSLIKAASVASVLVALTLITVKSWVWFLTGSLSVLASLVDSLLDAIASLINMLAIRYSMKSADRDHPFGHGKAEYLAGLGQSLFIGCSAVFVIMKAIERLIDPQPLTCTFVGVGVMIFAVVVTGGLVFFQSRVVARTGSMAIKADSLHYAADLFTNLGTVTALVLAWLGWPFFDPFIAVVIGLVVLYNAWQIGYESSQLLMDCQLSPEMEKRISDIALAHEHVVGVHDIKTRLSGKTRLIQMHLEMEGDIPLNEAHRITKEVEAEIHNTIPDADVIIHQDPAERVM